MFISSNNLNEGGCRDKCSEGRKREFHEGEDPKSTGSNWSSAKSSLHVNSNWQKLRK